MDKKKMQKVEEISNEVEQELSDFDILDVILDENNNEDLVLKTRRGDKSALSRLRLSLTMKKSM